MIINKKIKIYKIFYFRYCFSYLNLYFFRFLYNRFFPTSAIFINFLKVKLLKPRYSKYILLNKKKKIIAKINYSYCDL